MSFGHTLKVFFSGGATVYQAKTVIRQASQSAGVNGIAFKNAMKVYFQTSSDTDAVKLEVAKRLKGANSYFKAEIKSLEAMAKRVIANYEREYQCAQLTVARYGIRDRREQKKEELVVLRASTENRCNALTREIYSEPDHIAWKKLLITDMLSKKMPKAAFASLTQPFEL